MDIELAGSSRTYRPNDDQLSGLTLEFSAFDGDVGIGQLPFPDPSAVIDVYDGRAATVHEGGTLLSDGFIIDQDRERGPMPAGTARLHTFSIMDANALLDGFRVERTRPAETDVARVLAFAALDGPTWDTSMVINANTVTMPGKTYQSDGGWTGEFIPDLVEFTGKTLFLHDLTDGTGRCLHYHILEDGHTCGLSISDEARPNGPTVWNPWDPRRQRTSVDLRNDVKMRDQEGRTSTVTDATSITRHDADGLLHQALIDVEASSQADLDVKAAAMLASIKAERDTWTCSIGPLDEDALALIRVGDLIDVTSSVMGLEDSTQRIAHMVLSPVIGEGGRAAEGYWMAALELGAPVRRRARVNTKIVAPPAAPTFPDDEWTCIEPDFTVYWAEDDLPEGLCIIQPGDTSATTFQAGAFGDYLTLYVGSTYRAYYTVFHPPGSNAAAVFFEDGILSTIAYVDSGGYCEGNEPNYFGQFTYEFVWPASGPNPVYSTSVFGKVQSTFYVPCPTEGIIGQFGVRYVSGSDPRFVDLVDTCANTAPRIGQRVKQTSFLGDGTTIDFTTDWPYTPTSLNIMVNGLDWTSDILTSDPTTGDFTMAYPFPLGSTVVIRYRRAA